MTFLPVGPPHRSRSPRLTRSRWQPLGVELIGDRAVTQPLAPARFPMQLTDAMQYRL
jgi:hypothetical protein